MVTFLGNLTHIFQRLHTLKKGYYCVCSYFVGTFPAGLGCVNIFSKTSGTSNLKPGIMPEQQNLYLGTNTSITVGDSVLLISYLHKTCEPFIHTYYKHTMHFHGFLVEHLFPKYLVLDES